MSESEHSLVSNDGEKSRVTSQRGDVLPPLAHVPDGRTDMERCHSSTRGVLEAPRSSGFVPPPLTTEVGAGQSPNNSSAGDHEGRPATIPFASDSQHWLHFP